MKKLLLPIVILFTIVVVYFITVEELESQVSQNIQGLLDKKS